MSDALEAPCRITWGRMDNLLIQANPPHPDSSQREQRVNSQSQEKGVGEGEDQAISGRGGRESKWQTQAVLQRGLLCAMMLCFC